MNSILETEHEPTLGFQGILHTFFHRLEAGEGIVIAFTSANPGEGVSYVSDKIAAQLSASSSGSAICMTCAQLCDEEWTRSGSRADGFAKKKETRVSRTAWEDWRSKVSSLRSRYRYSIIDCPPISTGSDVLSLAPHVDGVVVVVAANQTHKAQIANVERQVQMVNGKILGFLLNKRKYMVPDWLYKII